MSFARPELIWLAPAALLLICWGAWRYNSRRRRLAALVGGPVAARRLFGSDLRDLPFGSLALVCGAALCISLAAAEPRGSGMGAAVEGEPWSILLAVDISRSMQGTDVAPTRLTQAAAVAHQFVDALASQKVGLMLFAGESYTLTPPTFDLDAVRYLAGGIEANLVNEDDDELRLQSVFDRALATFEQDSTAVGGRAVVLFTAGDSEEDPAQLLARARGLSRSGVRVFTVGIGTAEGSTLSRPHRPGRWGGTIMDESGEPRISRLRAPLLRDLAGATGGRYAAASGSDLGSQIREISLLAGSAPGGGSRWASRGPSFFLVLLSMAFLIGDSFMRNRSPWRRERRVKS